MGGRGVEKGSLQLDIGIVVSGLGGNSNQEPNQFNGFFLCFVSVLDSMSGRHINPFSTYRTQRRCWFVQIGRAHV